MLHLAGVDFRSSSVPLNAEMLAEMPPEQLVDAMHHALAGSFTHTILEWSAFCAAIFTAVLAGIHFAISRRGIVIPVIGVALVCAGAMDAFHTLAADRLIHATAANTNLIPFTWALCRLFNCAIMIIGVLVIFWRGQRDRGTQITFVIGSSITFALLAYVTIHLCASSRTLPQTMFPDSLVTRPYDVVPLVLYTLAGLFIFPRLYRKHPSYFTHGLLIGMIPDIVTQAHMAFGSTALFDSHFNIAHFLKIVSYLVPFVGLCMDYIRTYQLAEQHATDMERTNALLDRKQACFFGQAA
jgi:hypothetical protein